MIEAIKVEKKYVMGAEVVNALRGVSLKIDDGDFAVIIGPSGSGKSTLMHILGALDHPSKGTVFIDGRNITELDDYGLAAIRRNLIGFVFQSFNLIPTLNALENVMIPTENTGVSPEVAQERAIKILKQLGLGDRINHKPNELSGGQRQRLAIARSLINDPKIIFADEPTGNLDSVTGKQIISLMKELNKSFGKTFVIVTHDLSLLKHATREFHILDGRIVKDIKKKAIDE